MGQWSALIVVAVTLSVVIAIFRARLAIGLQIAFLIRFQLFLILSPLFLILLSFAFSEILGNLMVLKGNREAFYVAWVGFGSAWMSLAMMTIVFDHASDRFGVAFRTPAWFWKRSGLLFALPPIALMVHAFVESGRVGLLGFVSGLVAALGSVVFVDMIFQLLEPPGLPAGGRRFAFAGAIYPRSIRDASVMGDRARRLLRWTRWLGPGYLRPPNTPGAGLPFSGHLAASAAALVALVLYVASFYSGWWQLSHGIGTTGIPALAYLEFLFLILALVVSAAAFYLDRYRVPVVLAVAVYSVLVSMPFDTDHYWLASPPSWAVSGATAPNILPIQRVENVQYSDGVGAWLDRYTKANLDGVASIKGKPVVVVVCASGGGIEAAAWTAEVLTQLQRRFGAQFTRSIRLISSTSGGSVGALFFVQSTFTKGDAPADDQLGRIVDAAERSSLEATGWGLVHPDFARLMAPWLIRLWLASGSGEAARELDRGWALEQAWNSALVDPNSQERIIRSRLSDWRGAVNQGLLPGTVFNATLVESGNPLLLSTVAVPQPKGSNVVQFGYTDSDWGADISAVTAARLSATFTYVSPVARGRYSPTGTAGKPVYGFHVADGGYYDNYGFTVAAEWINDVARRYRDRIGKIIVIAIEAFPENSGGSKKAVSQPQERAKWLNPNGGWSSEIFGPIKAMLNARTATQLGRDTIEIDLLNNLNRSQTTAPAASSADPCPDFITTIPIAAQHVGPLSWQLSPDEKKQIDEDWTNPKVQDSVTRLGQCLGENAPHP